MPQAPAPGDARVTVVWLDAPLGTAALRVRPENLERFPSANDSVCVAATEALVGAVGPDLADEVLGHIKCTRCLEPFTKDGACRVWHPAHLQEDSGKQFGAGGCHFHFSCSACRSNYTLSCEDHNDLDKKVFSRGPE